MDENLEDSIFLIPANKVMRVRVKHDGIAMGQADFARLSNLIASGHLNFILGSGFSYDANIPTLGERENWFAQVATTNLIEGHDLRERLRMLLEAEYYESVLLPASTARPQRSHLAFASALHSILRNRGNTSIPKRANVFTTNYDLILEHAFEDAHIPYNDGFEGRLNPLFTTAAFSRIRLDQSMEHEYMSYVASASVLKMHGSLTWGKADSGDIVFKYPKDMGDDFDGALGSFKTTGILTNLIRILKDQPTGNGLMSLIDIAEELSDEDLLALQQFERLYRQLCIVNPTKEKFSTTVLELAYYELMRIYSNSLDLSNSLLISFGFSFADEHIRAITERALRNPKLVLVAFCHSERDFNNLSSLFGDFDNVWLVTAEDDDGEIAKLDLDAFAALLAKVADNG